MTVNTLSPAELSLSEIREEYKKAVNSEEANDRLLEKFEEEEINSSLERAYKAGVLALAAKHSYNPYKKWEYLKSSGELFEKAVEEEPDNIEIRFLRFSVEHYVPSFLGWSKHLEEDRARIIDNLEDSNNTPVEVRKVITDFLLESERCTGEEETMLEEYKKNRL